MEKMNGIISVWLRSGFNLFTKYNTMKKQILGISMVFAVLIGCQSVNQKETLVPLDIDEQIKYATVQATKTLQLVPGDSLLPRNVENGDNSWNFVPKEDWTSGFWPGTLWYLYEYTGNEKWKDEANKFTGYLKPMAYTPADNHDLGFMIYNSFGNGFRLTGDPEYKKVLLSAADTLSTLYNPKVGTILSWPAMVEKMNWPHNTIIDNMLNLELLFWASKNGGSDSLYDMANSHAEKTMENQFRPDFTVYHVVVYDSITGERIKRVTHQGYSDESLWARGQAWAIYGFTMTYRETRDERYLDFVQKVADVYLERLPEDLIPYWDFDAPNIPNEPRDASAAAITASALLELSTYVKEKEKAMEYRNLATRMLETLSTDAYQSRSKNSAFLLHSTGHMPNKSEVDASINYADYYYLEALVRLKNLREKNSLTGLR